MVKPGASPPALSPARWQVAGWPLAHDGHGGSIPRTRQPNAGLTTTRSPSRNPAARASLPTSASRPKISWPSTAGNEENGVSAGDILSSTVARSLPQKPVVSTAILAHAGPRSDGSGTSRSDKQESAPQ